MLSLLFTTALLAASAATSVQFPLADRVLTGQGATRCVIEGRWHDGAALRYRTWDACANLTVRAVSRASIGGATPLGRDKTTRVSDIPEGAEILQIANASSSVLLFRDTAGRQREILIGD